MNKLWFIAFFIWAGTTGCAGLKPSATSTNGNYTEDLTAYLPPPITDTLANNPSNATTPATQPAMPGIGNKLDSVLTLANEYRVARNKTVAGLTIQLYSGLDRNEAKNQQFKAIRYFPEAQPKLIFDQPNYKVRMGSFYTSLEAYPEFKKVQEKFPKAILVPARIKLMVK